MSDSQPKPPSPDNEISIFDMGISTEPRGKNMRRSHWLSSGPPVKSIFICLAIFLMILLGLVLKPSRKAAVPVPAPAPPVEKAPAPAAPAAPSVLTPPASQDANFNLPPLRPRTVVGMANTASFDLPIHTDTASADWIAKTIQLRGVLPDKTLVRTEDVLNHFSLRPNGPTAISRGITLSTESISCPWRPSATLFVISIRGAGTEDHVVSATFKPSMVNVARYKLLGFTTTTDPGFVLPKPTKLPAKAICTLVLEVEPSIAASELGNIEWSVDNQPAPPVPLSRRTDQEPSDDARLAALVCAYTQWLRYERPELIDLELVAALARELASSNLAPERAELLNLIDRSLHL